MKQRAIFICSVLLVGFLYILWILYSPQRISPAEIEDRARDLATTRRILADEEKDLSRTKQQLALVTPSLEKMQRSYDEATVELTNLHDPAEIEAQNTRIAEMKKRIEILQTNKTRWEQSVPKTQEIIEKFRALEQTLTAPAS